MTPPPKSPGRIRWGLLGALNLYGLLVLCYFVLKYTVGDSLSTVALCANCIPMVLLPALFALPLAVKKRRRFVMLWSGVATLFLIVEFGPRFVPFLRRPTPSSGSTVKILSHNTGQDLPEYAWRDQIIRDSQAGIVVLQEVTDEYIEKHWPQFLQDYPYQVHGPLQADRDTLVGMGILSRYPIVEHSSFKLDEDGLVYQLRTVVEINGQRVAIYGIHTTFPWFRPQPVPVFSGLTISVYDDHTRRDEIRQLIKRVKDEPYPVILAGDFNLSDQSDDYRALIEAGLTDAYREVGYGMGFTWPANRTPSVNIRPAIPSVRVDYVFHTAELAAQSAQVLTRTGSDHLPLQVNLSLNDLAPH